MKNADSHIYLYAKGHYQKGDLVEDLKRILGERSGIESEHITAADITHMLLKIVSPCIKTPYHFKEFVLDLHPLNYWRLSRGTYSFEQAVIRKCLSILRGMQVKDGDEMLIELDDPNPGILPLTKYTNRKEG